MICAVGMGGSKHGCALQGTGNAARHLAHALLKRDDIVDVE